jgi:hypothetical protein
MELWGKPESRRPRGRLLDWLNARYEPYAPPPVERLAAFGTVG